MNDLAAVMKFLRYLPLFISLPTFSVAEPEPHREPGYQKRIDAFYSDPARATEYLRPQYHFTPIAGGFNDPNGLAYFQGKWRYFYQHSGWGYAVSDDLVHYEHRIPAARPDELGQIWSGGGLVDDQNVSGLFGEEGGYLGYFTYKNDREGGRQSQAILYSADGEEFRKYEGNPVVPQLRHIEGQPDDPKFRDPKVFWHEPTERYVMVVAGGLLRFFSSENLIDWQFESVNEDINTECPDLFQLPVDGNEDNLVWVMNGGGVFYMLGEFDGKKFTPTTEQLPVGGGRDYYASQTFENSPNGRRIMSTWAFSWANQGWPGRPGGAMTLPTELSLVTTDDGVRLAQKPIDELETLRGEPIEDGAKVNDSDATLITRTNTAELKVTIRPDDAKKAGLHVFTGPNGERTVIGYDVERGEVYIDTSECGYPLGNMWSKVHRVKAPLKDGAIDLHVFLDWGMVEIFANDGLAYVIGLTAPQAGSDRISAFAEGGTADIQIKGWHLDGIWRDEEKTPEKTLSIRMMPAINAPMGEVTALMAAVYPEGSAAVEWESSDSSVVAVQSDFKHSQRGNLTPNDYGRATVTARVKGTDLTASSLVLVQDPSKFRTNVKARPLTKDWLYVGEGLLCDSQKRQLLYATKREPQKVSASVHFRSEAKAGLMLHGMGRTHDNGYFVELDSAKDTVRFYRQKGREVEVFGDYEVALGVGETYTITAHTSGRDPFTARIELDGKTLGHFKDLKPQVHWAYENGIFSQDGEVVFNDFVIE